MLKKSKGWQTVPFDDSLHLIMNGLNKKIFQLDENIDSSKQLIFGNHRAVAEGIVFLVQQSDQEVDEGGFSYSYENFLTSDMKLDVEAKGIIKDGTVKKEPYMVAKNHFKNKRKFLLYCSWFRTFTMQNRLDTAIEARRIYTQNSKAAKERLIILFAIWRGDGCILGYLLATQASFLPTDNAKQQNKQ